MSIPSRIQSLFSSPVTKSAIAAIAATTAITRLSRNFVQKTSEGHRSGITVGDETAQEIILQTLRSLEKDGEMPLFLAEEDLASSDALPKDNPVGILDAPLVFTIDPVDGTSLYASGLPGWCTGIGILRKGLIIGGAVFSPADNGGILAVSEEGCGVLHGEWDEYNILPTLLEAPRVPLGSAVILLGVDTLLYPNLMATIPTLAAKTRAIYASGSGIMSLANVALGKAQAVIQTPQKAWDWVPGYRMILERGGKFCFFRIGEDGELYFVDHYDHQAFLYAHPERLGFVAGEPRFVDYLAEQLPRSGWSRMDPDRI